jgi:hypothetical protein
MEKWDEGFVPGGRSIMPENKNPLAVVKEAAREVVVLGFDRSADNAEARARDQAIVEKWGGLRLPAVCLGISGFGLILGIAGAVLIAPPCILLFPVALAGAMCVTNVKEAAIHDAQQRLDATDAEERKCIEDGRSRIEAERCARLAKEALAVLDSNVEANEIREGANILFADPQNADTKFLLHVTEIADYIDTLNTANSGQQITAKLHHVTIREDGGFIRGVEIAGGEPVTHKIPHSSGPALSNGLARPRPSLPFPTP